MSIRRKQSSDEQRNSELVRHVVKLYQKKVSIPVTHKALPIPIEGTKYQMIRLTDRQYLRLCDNCLSILQDHGHLLCLWSHKDLIYSSLSKMYVALTELFGESSIIYDRYKSTFSFPFLLHFQNELEPFNYLLRVVHVRTSVDFRFAKIIATDPSKSDVMRLHEPFDELPRATMNYIINYFLGFLTGYFEVRHDHFDTFFYRVVESDLIIFGYKDGEYFDDQYDNQNEFNKAVQQMKTYKKTLR